MWKYILVLDSRFATDYSVLFTLHHKCVYCFGLFKKNIVCHRKASQPPNEHKYFYSNAIAITLPLTDDQKFKTTSIFCNIQIRCTISLNCGCGTSFLCALSAPYKQYQRSQTGCWPVPIYVAFLCDSIFSSNVNSFWPKESISFLHL